MKYQFSAKKFLRTFARDWQLHLLILFPVLYLVIFDFIPMYGIQISFRNYVAIKGMAGSDWVGLKHFADFLSIPDVGRLFWNTIVISLYSLATFPLPIIFALALNALRNEKYKRVVQTVSYMPYFISVTVMVGIIFMILSPTAGIYGTVCHWLSNILGWVGDKIEALEPACEKMISSFMNGNYPDDIRFKARYFRHLYVWSGVWQTLGWNSIIYMAALSSVSQELHEAAQIDGANRIKRMWHVDIPAIMPTIAIMLILRATSIIGVGFEKVYLMQRTENRSVSDVISTYIVDKGLGNAGKQSYGSAVGLFSTAINLTLLFSVNAIVKKATDGEVSLY